MKKRTYLLLLLAVLAAVGLGMLVAEHQGYVLISWKTIRFESTLWVFLICLALLLALLYTLRLITTALLASAGFINPWSSRNQRRRLQNAIEEGMLEFARGEWLAALKHLRYAAKTSKQPLPYLLTAAQAAQQLDQPQTADDLLQQALQNYPKQTLAIALCQAGLYEQRQQTQLALETLEAIYQKYSHCNALPVRLSQLAQQQHNWSLILQLLPVLRKNKRLARTDLDTLELRAWQGRLEQKATDLQQVQTIWETMPKTLHKHPELLLAYCSQLLAFNHTAEAESILYRQLSQQFDTQLLQAYAQLPHSDITRAINTAETWLQQAPKDAIALYALGKLCLQAQLWGKARDYLQASLQQQPTPKVYAELARLFSQMGDHKRSHELLTTSLNMQDKTQAVHKSLTCLDH